MLFPSPSPKNAVPFCQVPRLRPPSAPVAFRFQPRTNSHLRFGLPLPPSASVQPVGHVVRLNAMTAHDGTVLRLRSSRFADIWFQSVLVSCCHVETVPSDEKAALAIAAKPIAETIPAPIFSPFRNSEGRFPTFDMGLLFYAVNSRYVFWPGFVSARSLRVLGRVSIQRIDGASGRAGHDVDEARKNVRVAFQFVRLRASHFVRPRSADTGSEIDVVRRGRIRTPDETSAEVHGIGSSSDGRIVRAVGQIPSGRTGVAVERHDGARRHGILEQFVPFVLRERFVCRCAQGRIGGISGGRASERGEKCQSGENGFSVGEDAGHGFRGYSLIHSATKCVLSPLWMVVAHTASFT